MNIKKIVALTAITAILFLAFAPLALATEYTIDSMASQGIGAYYWDGSNYCGSAQTFTPSININISRAEFLLKAVGNPIGTLTAILYNRTDWSIVQNSSTLAMESISTTEPTWYSLPFTGTQVINTTDTLAIALVVSSANQLGSENYLRVYFDGTSAAPNANGVEYYLRYGHTWTFGGGLTDLNFKLYGNDGVGPTPATTPTPYGNSGDPTDVNRLINDFMDFIVPIIVMLIPAVILGYVLRMGKWGYIIGLAIGTGLGVMFITDFPLWLAFAVFIGLVGFAYSEVRRRG